MSKPAPDELDRPNGRFVRNVALSLSGGALLALLGAGAAHAQDASTAGTNSAGLGSTGTGDATAVGNHSGSNTTQGGTISGAQGSVQVITQSGTTNNRGVGIANTGGNTATGNSSTNSTDATQNGEGGAGGAVNDGQAANGSDGVAFITTGSASAIGNQSTTNLNQTINARGALGGILVLAQDSTVTNSGRAFAGSGGNTATGNASSSEADLGQGFLLDDGLGSNSGKATTSSDGKATVASGAASAMGNVSDTSVTQSSNGAAGGDEPGGGLVVIPQTAEVTNDGRARATSGGNTATGNEASSTAAVGQQIGTDSVPSGPFFQTGLGVASNSGTASTWADGTASIATGASSAVGNRSSSDVRQSAGSDLTHDGGLSVLPQSSTIDNTGRARANSGGNTATGNGTTNDNFPNLVQSMSAPQILGSPVIPGFLNSGVASNAGEADASSDGTASIVTGAASAVGNSSTTSTSQSSTANANDLNIYPQTVVVSNSGVAFAGTGDNRATGNAAESDGTLDQEIVLPTNGLADGVLSNAGRVSTSSDGSATITTGDATAVGDASSNDVSQEIDPIGLVLPTQTAAVVNAGLGVALTGGNQAEGNGSTSSVSFPQVNAPFGDDIPAATVDVGLVVASNQADASDSSNGSASIVTGSAWATGNESGSTIAQESTGAVTGAGLILNTQVAGVLNAGAAVATTGGNGATGNESANDLPAASNTAAGGDQFTQVGESNRTPASYTAGLVTVSGAMSASNTSDGTATVHTGDARSSGNRSSTDLWQHEDGSVGGVGGVLDTQVAAVANIGLGVANSGGNAATGNTSSSAAATSQTTTVGGDNTTAGVTVTAPSITSSTAGSESNDSGGTAEVTTGSASAVGNASTTEIRQDPGNEVSGFGLVVSTQVATVADVGVGVANSGLDGAVGNASNNVQSPSVPGALANQDALIGGFNSGAGTTRVTATGPVVADNVGAASNRSDGTARVRTGAASAEGDVASTTIDQVQSGSVDGLGVVVDTQVAGVANGGVGIANSGLDLAVGNASDNSGRNIAGGANAGSDAEIGSGNSTGSVDLTGLGPIVASAVGSASNTSNGTALVGTGPATASGNRSTTTIRQHQTSAVDALGIDVSTQAAGVANVGLGVANSGLNAAIGNASGAISPSGGPADPNEAVAGSDAAFILSGVGAPDVLTSPVTVLGPTTASVNDDASNDTDGTACVCTGAATASGNISSTTIDQGLDTSVGTGAVVLTEAGGVLNAGVGIANSGLNLALGNISENQAIRTGSSTINTGLAGAPGGIVGPQTAVTGGAATNAANGTGKVGTGNASATGNESTTGLVQAASVDSDLAVDTLAGGTTNTGLGLANSGVNLGVGNASVNTALLTQSADGAGLVSSTGSATNESDGSGLVGNPSCNVPGTSTPTPGHPGASTLPHTGAPIEAEAIVGLLLLLAGFGLRRGAGDGNRTRVLSLGS